MRHASSWAISQSFNEVKLVNSLGPVELWALSTTPGDTALRNRLYARIGFSDQPTLGRVRLHEVSLRISYSPENRSHSVAKLQMSSKKRQKGFVTQFRRRHSRPPAFAEPAS
jgi:hypothetical protein